MATADKIVKRDWLRWGGKTKRQHLLSLHAQYQTDRSSFDPHWRELADFHMPRRTRFTVSDRNRGERRNQNIIDSTARFAMRTLESGLYAGMTSPQVPWFNLALADQDLMEYPPVREYLHDLTRRTSAILTGSNFYNSLPTLYGDMGLFGTGAIAVLPDRKDLIRTFVYPVGSYNIGVDERGLTCAFTMEYGRNVEQVVGEFGGEDGRPLEPHQEINWTNISQQVKDHWDRGNYTAPVTIVWVITKNLDYQLDAIDSKHYAYASCHIELGSSTAGENGREKILRESGFKYFPIMAPRWHVSDTSDTYGNDCPGMTALGDVKGLQMQQREKAKGIKKTITPPVQAPLSLMGQPISLVADGVTHVDAREGMQGIKSIYDNRVDLSGLTDSISDVRFLIERAWYADLFLMLANADARGQSPQRTAREIEEKHDEKYVALGPLVERTGTEFLTPAINVVIDRMQDARLVPEAPPELEGLNAIPEYISTMAQAQKLINVGRQDRFLTAAMQVAQVYPEARFKIDPFYIIDSYADMYGVHPKLVVPTPVAQQRAAQAEQQAAAMARAQVAKDGAQAAKLASETDTSNPESALAQLAETV